MADFYPQLVSLLLAAGCRLVRPGKGSQEIWHRAITGRNFSLPRTTKSRHTANEVLKQAGLPKVF
ncbi:type II toxin-antitoxin system HicA family toxin [Methylocystis sp. WRRC1]|uniref:type II toxin-antitoxin system HicA family toxin n=1 Tax=Methylocystis sp. WRRC1 TaxID=1732014 RepID=UPI001D13ACD5|nr:type II toxin-antitoxin system HicA family toxin [Methylocystis sp. WRRC1]MCC3246828.1 type II toxin-antitoxin system HicA family toxin [Methylocystis sp. WRRC1]